MTADMGRETVYERTVFILKRDPVLRNDLYIMRF